MSTFSFSNCLLDFCSPGKDFCMWFNPLALCHRNIREHYWAHSIYGVNENDSIDIFDTGLTNRDKKHVRIIRYNNHLLHQSFATTIIR
jgi:hypothetical protein